MNGTNPLHKLRVPGRPLSPEAYAKAVAKVVAGFQERIARAHPNVTTRELERILTFAREVGRPFTYDEVTAAVGIERRQCAGRLFHLVKDGRLRKVGRISRMYQWHRKDGTAYERSQPSALYEYIQDQPSATALSAYKWLNRQMDKLDQRRALGLCVISSHSFAGQDRNVEIVAKYVRGATLVDIGREYGISRERTRQIVAAAINRRRRLADGV